MTTRRPCFSLVGHEDRRHAALTQEPLHVVPVGQRLGDRFLKHGPRVRDGGRSPGCLCRSWCALSMALISARSATSSPHRLVQLPGPRLLGQLERLVEELAEPVPAWIGIH